MDQAKLREWGEDSPDIRTTHAERTNIRPSRDQPWEYGSIEKKSGNVGLNKFIEEKKLKWIPYNRLTDIEQIGKGGFGTIYKATFDNGMKVALKSFNSIQHKHLDTFLREWEYHADCLVSYQIVNFLGFTEDETENKKEGRINYMAVMEYADNGTLYSNLERISKCSWKEKLYILYKIATGLSLIHLKGLIHRDLHHHNILFNNGGNDFVLGGDDDVLITDLGLCQSINSVLAEKGKDKKVYGITPFVACEILEKEDYTEASDIYSFSIIMWELTSGREPYGIFHPEVLDNTPECYKKLMEECWDDDPSNRPTSIEVANKIFGWISYSDNTSDEVKSEIMQFKNAKPIKYNKNNSLQSNSGGSPKKAIKTTVAIHDSGLNSYDIPY